MSENTNMQAVLKEKQENLVDAINNAKSKSYKNPSNNKSVKEFNSQTSDDDNNESSEDYTSDDDYIDLEGLINEHSARLTALEERISNMEAAIQTSNQ